MAKYYDLSPTLGPRTPAWPTDPPVTFEAFKALADGGSSNVTLLTLGTHAGSHIDAPRHMYGEGGTIDEIPLDLLIGEAEVVEVGTDIVDEQALRVLDGKSVDRLLLKTANSRLWSRPDFEREFVGLTREAADYLLKARVKLVGIDYLSIEAAHGTGAPVHMALLRAGVVIVESLDLSNVPAGRYELFCLPLKLSGLDGAPARVVLRSIER